MAAGQVSERHPIAVIPRLTELLTPADYARKRAAALTVGFSVT
jgi:hypothetical protein